MDGDVALSGLSEQFLSSVWEHVADFGNPRGIRATPGSEEGT